MASIRYTSNGTCWLHLIRLAAALRSLRLCSGEEAADSASNYWKGGRVKASQEGTGPLPIFNNGGRDIEYHGRDDVRECMEFYIDKEHEETLRRRLTSRELEVAESFESASSPSTNESNKEARGVVTYLLMENAGRTIHRDLLLSLHCLGRFFGRYPVVVFHTNASTAAELNHIRNQAPDGLQLIFEEVHLEFPRELVQAPGGPDGFLAPPKCVMDGRHWWTSNRSCGCRCPAWRPQCWPSHWMHATRFFTADMFRTWTFRTGNFDFFMRLDSDLFFVEAPIVDPFQLMTSRGCAMVYDRLSRESPGCHDGFDERTMQHMLSSGLDVFLPDMDILHVGRGPAAAGGQWTIGDARLFGSDEYLHFADTLASGIFTDRWADQIFLVRGVALFGPRAGRPVVWQKGTPEVSICIRSLFSGSLFAQELRNDADIDAFGFVHKKGGYLQTELLQRCGAEHVAFA